jgi:hypothetical protein
VSNPEFTSPSIAAARGSRRAHGHGSAARCAWRIGDDRISFYKRAGAVSDQAARAREQRRNAEEIGRLTGSVVNGPVRIDNIARIERGLGPSTLQRSNASSPS